MRRELVEWWKIKFQKWKKYIHTRAHTHTYTPWITFICKFNKASSSSKRFSTNAECNDSDISSSSLSGDVRLCPLLRRLRSPILRWFKIIRWCLRCIRRYIDFINIHLFYYFNQENKYSQPNKIAENVHT
jgi:hypothetical protein